MHEETTNNTNTNPKYDNFKMHQKIVSNLEKDDVNQSLIYFQKSMWLMSASVPPHPPPLL